VALFHHRHPLAPGPRRLKIIDRLGPVEHDVALTFQAPFEAKLLRPLIRRLMFPIVAGVGAAGLLVALLIAVAGERVLAVEIAGSSVVTMLVMPWYIASENVKRIGPRPGHAIAYRVDRSGVQVLGGFATRTLTWPEITRIDERRGQVALYFGRRSVQSIPTGTLTAEERAHLQHLVRSRGANADGRAISGS